MCRQRSYKKQTQKLSKFFDVCDKQSAEARTSHTFYTVMTENKHHESSRMLPHASSVRLASLLVWLFFYHVTTFIFFLQRILVSRVV